MKKQPYGALPGCVSWGQTVMDFRGEAEEWYSWGGSPMAVQFHSIFSY